MLRIRFSRTGKVGQPSFRIVLSERTAPVKGRALELLGNYLPARNPKVTTLNKERISYWISKGAQPTDSVAALLKKEGMSDMDKFMEPRNKQRKMKGEEVKPAAAPAAEKPAAKAEASASAEKPAEAPSEKAPAPAA